MEMLSFLAVFKLA